MTYFVEPHAEDIGVIGPGRLKRYKEIIFSLIRDHNEINRQLSMLQLLDRRRDWQDYEEAKSRAIELWSLIKRHISDEESKLQLIFADISLGEPKSLDEIMVQEFGQHKLILATLENLLSDPTHLVTESFWRGIEQVETLLCSHMEEEDDTIFPMLIGKF